MAAQDVNDQGYTQDQLILFAKQAILEMEHNPQFKFVSMGDGVNVPVPMQVYPLAQGGQLRAGYDSDQNICYIYWRA